MSISTVSAAAVTVCTDCAAGRRSNDADPPACEDRAVGHYAAQGVAECDICHRGEVDADSSAATPCTMCVVGQYSGQTATTCIDCPAGYHDYDSNPATPCDGTRVLRCERHYQLSCNRSMHGP